MMVLHVKDAIITENYKVLAGSLESEGDNGSSVNWVGMMHNVIVLEGEEVHKGRTKTCLPTYGKTSQNVDGQRLGAPHPTYSPGPVLCKCYSHTRCAVTSRMNWMLKGLCV